MLDEDSRALVVLREIDGMSYEDIAAAMDLPLPTVKTRLFQRASNAETSTGGLAMSLMRRHRAPSRLQNWLESGESARVGRHVAECDRCLVALEELSDLDDGLVADLTEALSPPSDFEDRAAEQLERRLRNEDALLVFLDLFAVGWDTVRTIFHTEEESNG